MDTNITVTMAMDTNTVVISDTDTNTVVVVTMMITTAPTMTSTAKDMLHTETMESTQRNT